MAYRFEKVGVKIPAYFSNDCERHAGSPEKRAQCPRELRADESVEQKPKTKQKTSRRPHLIVCVWKLRVKSIEEKYSQES